ASSSKAAVSMPPSRIRRIDRIGVPPEYFRHRFYCGGSSQAIAQVSTEIAVLALSALSLGFAAVAAPFGVGDALELERVALARVGVAAQAADRAQRREVDVEGGGVDDAVAHVHAQHLADQQLALRAERQSHGAPAFEGCGGGFEARRFYQRGSCKPQACKHW